MSLSKKVFAAPARLWMNWPLWGGLLAALLLAKHVWVLFAPAERAVPATAAATQSTQTEQLFGTISTSTSSASLSGIRPIGIFASKQNGFAVMMTEGGQVGVGLGGQVVPGVRLVETHPDYVILERNGTRQRADLSAAPAATGATPAQAAPVVRGMTVPPAGGQLLDQLTPEQKTILQQQQRDLIRGRP
jgi:general secretion pathway protein C